jgi:hypothetical protein
MTPLRRRLSRLELGLIAAALLLPIPLVALNGYAAALPDAVGRGLGSLVTLEAGDERSGTEVRGNASEDGSDTRRSGHGLLSIGRGTGTSTADDSATPSGSGGSAAPDSTDEANSTPQGKAPDGSGDTGGSGPAADGGGSGPADGGEAPSNGGAAAVDAGNNAPALSVSGGGQGTGASVSVGSDGATVDLDGDSGGPGGSGGVGVEIRDTDGSSTGIGIGVPTTGGVIP